MRQSMCMRAMVIILLCWSVMAFGSVPMGVDLAKLQGWDIVVAKDAIESEKYAAKEFQGFFEQASGLQLPIVHDTNSPQHHIFIGSGKAMQASGVGFSVADFGPEDLRIVVRNENIAIAGGVPRGTLYGVYTFLEDYVGVRFLTANHTYVPPVGSYRLVAPVDRFYHPPFGKVRIAGYLMPWQNPVFGVRTRTSSLSTSDEKLGGVTPYGVINHTFYRQLPAEKYAKDHPEYFCLFDGERLTDPGTHLQGNNPCYASPDVLDIITKSVLDEIEGPKGLAAGRLNYAVSQNDSAWTYCRCDKCAAIDKREGSSMGVLLDFVNKVADRVAAVHPNVNVGTLSYFYSRKPPATIKPRSNVEIWLCSIECCQMHALNDPNCPENVMFMRDLERWRKIADHLSFWTYNVNFYDYLLPYPNLRAIEANVRLLAEFGGEGVFMQCSDKSSTEMSDLRCYVISSLLWDPSRNVDQLVDEFTRLHYGNAAPCVRQFINRVQNHYRAAGTHNASNMAGRWDLPVDLNVAMAGVDDFERAVKAAENETVRLRVEEASICAYRAAIEPVWKLGKDEKIDAKTAGQMRPLAAKFFSLCKEYGLSDLVAAKQQSIEAILAEAKTNASTE